MICHLALAFRNIRQRIFCILPELQTLELLDQLDHLFLLILKLLVCSGKFLKFNHTNWRTREL